MAVLVNNRKESKLEPIVCSVELHKMLTDLIQKDFGVRDLDHLVRVRYAYGRDATENFSRYRYLMQTAKNNIDQMAFLLTNNLRGANSIYPTSMREYEQRRDYQNFAIVNCEQIIKELQRVVETFETWMSMSTAELSALSTEKSV